MLTAGLDVGSARTKVVVWKDGGVLGRAVVVQGAESVPATVAKALGEGAAAAGVAVADLERIAATGVGREECDPDWTKLVDGMCLARAAGRTLPSARVVLDVGAQKVLAVRCVDGKALKFSRNEQCAGGTGRFLEMAGGILGLSLSEMDEVATRSTSPTELQNVCSVFAESELLSQIHVTKAPVPDLAAGVLQALANRLFPLVAKVGLQPEVLLGGGVSQSKALRRHLDELLGFPSQLPEDGEYLSALGAAIIAAEGFQG